MKRLIEFPLEDGSTILVEADVSEEPGAIPAMRGGPDKMERAGQTFEEALERIRPVAQTIIKKLRALHDPPDQIQVEFGLKLSAQAGALIAAVSTEANYKVVLTWKRDTAES